MLFRLGSSSCTPILRWALSSSPPLRRPLSLSSSRCQMSDVTSNGSSSQELDLNRVLENPADPADLLLSPLNSLLPEPSFASQGLAHWYPSGWLQALMETIHVDAGVPWWGTIVGTTVALRLVIFPVLIKARKNMWFMNEHLPAMQKMQITILTNANLEEKVKADRELKEYQKKTGIHPIKSYLPMVASSFTFASMFFAIRGMANAPVESLKTQGLYWFVDLTATDPFFLLPLITSTSLFVVIKFGADGPDLKSMPPFVRPVILMVPLIMIPAMAQFPAALNLYWMTNNLISLGQAQFLKHPTVMARLGLKPMTVWTAEDLPLYNYGQLAKIRVANEKIEREKRREKEGEKKEYEVTDLEEIEKNLRKQLIEDAEKRERKEKKEESSSNR